MKIADVLGKTGSTFRANASEICVGLSISGVISTAVLTCKATIKAHKALEPFNSSPAAPLQKKEVVKKTWVYFVPPAITAGSTIGLIVYGNRISARRLAASASIVSLTQRSYDAYRDEVANVIGAKKEELVRAKLAEEKTQDAPVIVVGEGVVICHEAFTDRYFRSDMETIRAAVNKINAKLNSRDTASLSDFYELLDLPCTSQSSLIGWDSDRLLELRYSSVLAAGGRPCLSFEYNYVKPL